VTLLVGASASLICVASGDPSPIVRWLRYYNEVGVDDGGHLEAEGGLLLINNVTMEYDGWYECEASNGVGPAQRRTVVVDVLGTFSLRTVVSTRLQRALADLTIQNSINMSTHTSASVLSNYTANL